MGIFARLISLFSSKHKDVRTTSDHEQPPPIHDNVALLNPADFEKSIPLPASTRRVTVRQDPLRPAIEAWQEIRQKVFLRDGWRCQVTGCLTTHTHLECHHLKPVAQGGTHELDNLVTLCLFHHACQEDHDVHAMRDRADTSRYWIKPSFMRLGIRVRCHFGRRVLVTANDLKAARDTFQITCRCGSRNWKGYYRTKAEDLVVLCPDCRKGWRMILGLMEETCVALTICMLPTAKIGKISVKSFSTDIAGIRLRTEAVSACPYCFLEDGRCGYLVRQKGIRGIYLACSNKMEPKIRCPYTKAL